MSSSSFSFASAPMPLQPKQEGKVLIFDISNTEQYFDYWVQVRATCSQNELEHLVSENLVEEERPATTMFDHEVPPDAMDSAQWAGLKGQRWIHEIERWDKKQGKRKTDSGKAAAVFHQHLMPAGKQTIAEALETPNQISRLKSVKEMVKGTYGPHGEAIKFEIQSRMRALTDKDGVIHMIDQMTKFTNQLRLIDANAALTDGDKKQILSHGVTTAVFANHILEAAQGETYEGLKKTFIRWCLDKPHLDENKIKPQAATAHTAVAQDGETYPTMANAPPIKNHKKTFFPAGSCYNCGSRRHLTGGCRHPQCGGCGQSWALANLDADYHTSLTCPNKPPPSGGGGRGGGRGGGGNAGRGGGGRGGRGSGKAAKANKSAKAAVKATAAAAKDQKEAVAAMLKCVAQVESMDARLKSKNI